jgi:hypothetical protein
MAPKEIVADTRTDSIADSSAVKAPLYKSYYIMKML